MTSTSIFRRITTTISILR